MKMESMRQIKFKGKSRDTKNWVYGSLVKTPFGTFIEWYEDSVCNKVEIDPSTVCQYTGLKDCKGQDIWEHDLLELQGSYEYKYSETIFEVFWNPEIASFVLGYLKSKGNYPSKTLGKSISCFPLAVISNRFDKEEGK